MTERTDWIVAGDDVPMRVRADFDDMVILEDHWMPRTLEISANGAANDAPDPETYARVEVNDDGVPRLMELRFTCSDPDSVGIRQTDLRDFEVKAVVEDLLAGFTFRGRRDEDGKLVLDVQLPDTNQAEYAETIGFLGRQRGGRTTRDITPELLRRVAKVYRDNIAKHPTKAVQSHFQVSQRMAAEYVSRARKRGLLPPTSRGRKNA